MKMIIEVDFSYDDDMDDISKVSLMLKCVLESGAESTNAELKLVRVISIGGTTQS